MKKQSLLMTGALLAGLGAGIALGSASRRRKFSFYGRSVVITGGSRGLGFLMARELASQGARITLLARNEDELRRAQAALEEHGASVLTIPCDLRKRDEVDAAINKVVQRFGTIDVLINNAGIIQVGPLEHMTMEDFEDALAVHFFGPLYTTLAVLPHMSRSGGGRMVNISSMAGKMAVPHMLPYVASKFALTGLSDALRLELRRENIFVTTVCPGLMRTGSPPNAQFKGKHRAEYAWFAISDSLPLISMDAARAARKIIAACRRGAPRLILGIQTKAAVLFNELFPGTTTQVLAIVDRLLPGRDQGSKTPEQGRSGWESQSAWAPSLLTRLSDKAAARNNEQPS
jgi:short-subunit dehydrogenase